MPERPAIEGAEPVRPKRLPALLPLIDDSAIEEVVATMTSGWLATGPRVAEFEKRFAERVGAPYAVAVNSGTAALYLALRCANIEPGDEVITPSFTFCAAVNQLYHLGAKPVFADIEPDLWNLNTSLLESCLTPRTKAIMPVHFAGRPCNMTAIKDFADQHGLSIISDSAHVVDASCDDQALASFSTFNAYSFHPCKNLTSGEGGMLTLLSEETAGRARRLRFHGLQKDAWRREGDTEVVTMDIAEPGFKLNMSDLQAGIGLRQLDCLDDHQTRRQEIWDYYQNNLASCSAIQTPAATRSGSTHSLHMYNVLIDPKKRAVSRQEFISALDAENIGTGIHYPAVHRMTAYKHLAQDDDLPVTALVADTILTLPLHAGMSMQDAHDVVVAVRRVSDWLGRAR